MTANKSNLTHRYLSRFFFVLVIFTATACQCSPDTRIGNIEGLRHVWTQTWGRTKEITEISDIARILFNNSIAVNSAGDCFVAGSFSGEINFDPDSRQITHDGHGMFLVKHNSFGELDWVLTWELDKRLLWLNMLFDNVSSSIYLAGGFTGTVDLNPGIEEDIHISNGGLDCFFIKLDSEGNYEWGRSWGGPSPSNIFGDTIREAAILPSGDIAVAGVFEGTVDLDPGIERQVYTSCGDDDVFISIYDQHGTLKKLIVLDIGDEDVIYELKADSENHIYLMLVRSGSIYMDPMDESEDSYFESDESSILAKYDSSLNYIWSRALPIASWSSLTFGEYGEIYIVGNALEEDLNNDNGLTSNEGQPVLINLNASSDLNWTKAWGEQGMDYDIHEFNYMSDDNLLIIGSKHPYGEIGPPNAFIMILSGSQLSTWTCDFDSSGNISINDAELYENNIIVCGNYVGTVKILGDIGISEMAPLNPVPAEILPVDLNKNAFIMKLAY